MLHTGRAGVQKSKGAKVLSFAEGGLASQPIEGDVGRSFWSATDDMKIILCRKQKYTYAQIAPLLQNPTRTAKALSAHFWATLRLRISEQVPMTLTAEWQDKYMVAAGWERREGCRYEQLLRWNTGSLQPQALTSANIKEICDLSMSQEHPSIHRVANLLSFGDSLEHAIFPLNSSELLQFHGNGICDTDL